MSEDTRNESIALLERIANQDPSSPLYLPVAERMREQGRVEEAIRLCEERRGRPGEGVGDHVVLGRCYLAAGRLQEARLQFETAVAMDRENVIALKALAGILSHEGQHGVAADFYRAVCRIDPGDLESQSALHQITSGEFPEVRPPDLLVSQGNSTWQPVQPPREEEYLGELSLGLPTFESFDVEPPKPYVAKVQDFQEMNFDKLDVEHMAPETVETAGEGEGFSPSLKDKGAESGGEPSPSPIASAVSEAPVLDVEKWQELPRTPLPASEEKPGPPKHEQNRSTFETWLSRLKKS